MAQVDVRMPDLPKDSSRLLAGRIDYYAQTDGSRVYASVPRSENLADGFRDITYTDLARAVDRAAWWMDEQLGKEHAPFESLAYIGPTDLRYVAMIVAGIKTSRMTLVPSPWMSALGLTRILDAAECRTLAFGTPVPSSPWFSRINQEHPELRTLEIPSFQQWFDNNESDDLPYVYQKTWDEAIDNPVLVLTTSGSTGPPKILVYRNSTLVYFDSQYQLGLSGPSLTVNQFKGKRLWSSWSMAHLGGIYTTILHPIYFHNIVVLGPPIVPLSVDLSDQMILHGNISSTKYPPYLLDDIATRPKSLQLMFDKLEMIQYGSAPLNRATAATLTADLYVQSTYATTEMLFPPYFPLEKEDWEYYHFHPYAGFDFRPRKDGLFELFVVRKEEYRDFQPVFTVLPDTSCFATKDLWAPHPTKPGLWRHRGRIDDIIILSEGSLVETTGIASAIQEHPSIRAAIVGGAGRIAPYLLVELVDTCRDSVRVDTLWPSIDEVNKRLGGVDTAVITRERVIIAPSTKPFARLTKGSVDRKTTVLNFEQEIENCYVVCC